jgi:hypothetical protein
MITFINNPFDCLLEGFQNLYPQFHSKNIVVQLNPEITNEVGEPVVGRTTFSDDDKNLILIDISSDLPIEGMTEILSHELAHVVLDHNGDRPQHEQHDADFDLVMDTLHDAYSKVMSAKFNVHYSDFLNNAPIDPAQNVLFPELLNTGTNIPLVTQLLEDAENATY